MPFTCLWIITLPLSSIHTWNATKQENSARSPELEIVLVKKAGGPLDSVTSSGVHHPVLS